MKLHGFTSKGATFAVFFMLAPADANAAAEDEFWYCDPKSPCYQPEPKPAEPPVVLRPRPRPPGFPCGYPGFDWIPWCFDLDGIMPAPTAVSIAVADGGRAHGGGRGSGSGGPGGPGGAGGAGGDAYAVAQSSASAEAKAKAKAKADVTVVIDKRFDNPPPPPPDGVIPLGASGWFMVAGVLGLGWVARKRHALSRVS